MGDSSLRGLQQEVEADLRASPGRVALHPADLSQGGNSPRETGQPDFAADRTRYAHCLGREHAQPALADVLDRSLKGLLRVRGGVQTGEDVSREFAANGMARVAALFVILSGGTHSRESWSREGPIAIPQME